MFEWTIVFIHFEKTPSFEKQSLIVKIFVYCDILAYLSTIYRIYFYKSLFPIFMPKCQRNIFMFYYQKYLWGVFCDAYK